MFIFLLIFICLSFDSFSDEGSLPLKQPSPDEEWSCCTGWCDTQQPLSWHIGEFRAEQMYSDRSYVKKGSDVRITIHSLIRVRKGAKYQSIECPDRLDYSPIKINDTSAQITSPSMPEDVSLQFKEKERIVVLNCRNSKTYEEAKSDLVEFAKFLLSRQKGF